MRINTGATAVPITSATESSVDPVVGYTPLTLHTAAVPEPSTIIFGASALLAGAFVTIRRRRKTAQ